jgi:hypothetical protein
MSVGLCRFVRRWEGGFLTRVAASGKVPQLDEWRCEGCTRARVVAQITAMRAERRPTTAPPPAAFRVRVFRRQVRRVASSAPALRRQKAETVGQRDRPCYAQDGNGSELLRSPSRASRTRPHHDGRREAGLHARAGTHTHTHTHTHKHTHTRRGEARDGDGGDTIRVSRIISYRPLATMGHHMSSACSRCGPISTLDDGSL